ncbi:hypothetical protein D3C72_1985280 [compost metagenome]
MGRSQKINKNRLLPRLKVMPVDLHLEVLISKPQPIELLGYSSTGSPCSSRSSGSHDFYKEVQE